MWLTSVVVFCTLVGSLVNTSPAIDPRECDRNDDVGGCSIPIDPKIFYETTFIPSCDRHDVCYVCHEQYNITRRECDVKFINNMLTACTRRDDDLCKLAAIFYYIPVRLYGGLFFNNRPDREWCLQPWVSSCVHNGIP